MKKITVNQNQNDDELDDNYHAIETINAINTSQPVIINVHFPVNYQPRLFQPVFDPREPREYSQSRVQAARQEDNGCKCVIL